MHYNVKGNVTKSFSICCPVNGKQLGDIVKRFAEKGFFVAIENLRKKDRLIQTLSEREMTFVSSINNNTVTSVIVKADLISFITIIDLLMDCESEVIVMYFPNPEISFEQFLFNNNSSTQKQTISKGLCSIICTWVSNNYELHFHYDTLRFSSTIKKEIKQLLGV